MSDLSWFATYNAASSADLPDLAAVGITVLGRSQTPVHVYRDPETGRMLAVLGNVTVWRDGRVQITPRHDCPDVGLTVLAQTALDCAERDLHQRDRWHYYRATARQTGQWSARISAWIPEGHSLFDAHAAVLQPASAPAPRVTADSRHQRA